MKILSLRVEQFRKFDRPVMIEGFGDGLNLITGPNETGKSTLLLAMRAVLFERHSTKSDTTKAFSPHHVTGARPTVTLDFEIDDERFQIKKSFLRRPSIHLETSSGRRSEGAEAEAELKRLLRLNPSERTPINKGSPAHFGILLTPQTRSFHQPDLADSTRHSLEAAIAADIAELGNQSEVDGLLAEFEEDLYGFVDKRGKPKGDYEKVVARLADVEREIAEATSERETLDDQFERLEQAVAERSQLRSGERQERLAERLTALESSRKQAVHYQTLDHQRLAAGQRLQAAEAKRAAHHGRLEARERLQAERETAIEKADEARTRLRKVEETLSEKEGQLADLGERQHVVRQRSRDLERLAQLYQRFSQIETTLSALATDVRLELDSDALDRVTLDGEPAPAASDLRQVTEGLSIEIAGIGRIGIEPKTEPMRVSLSAKADVEKEIGNLLIALDLKNTEPEAIETAWKTVISEEEGLAASRTEIDSVLGRARQQAAEIKASLEVSEREKERLTQNLAEIDAADKADAGNQAVFDAETAEARAALEAAESAFKAEAACHTPGTTPAVELLDAEITELRRRIEEQRLAIEEVSKKVVALESAIAVRSELGLDDKIDQLDRERHLLKDQRDAFALDHQALSLLQSTLRAAADEAKATFNAPLSARLAPYIKDLFPSATPVVTPDFSIRALDRDGVEEPFLQLSDGTREQIAILARLAFADMLQEQGLPALLVLDDALAFSDRTRFERMIAILEKAARRMQVIILTCREDRFAGIEANRLAIRPAIEEASSAA